MRLLSLFSLGFATLALASTCETDEDCSLNGLCKPKTSNCPSGKRPIKECVCDPGWFGEDCGRLDLAPALKTAGYNQTLAPNVGDFGPHGNASWGGRILQDPEDPTRFHLFTSQFANGCGLGGWRPHSLIVRAESTTGPQGPYHYAQTVTKSFRHNPDVFYSPADKKYLMYTIGVDAHELTRCQSISVNSWPNNISVASADDIRGPWSEFKLAVNTDRANGIHATNPSPFPLWTPENPTNDIALLIKDYDIFLAKGFDQKYEHIFNAPWNTTEHGNPLWTEDPFIWRDKRGNWHSINHWMIDIVEYDGRKYPRVGSHLYSRSLTGPWHFKLQEAFNSTINYTDGSVVTLNRRERPKLFFSDDGEMTPLYLVTGVTPLGETRKSSTFIQPIELAAAAIGDDTISPGDIQIFSLATIPDPWKRWQSKVATLMFRKTPSALLSDENARTQGLEEWAFKVHGLPEPLILDTQFHGMTVLNEVNPSFHEYDCIVLSGLASHPFGSWQPKGDDKSFMWIRDVLPTIFPTIRFVLYGYDTTLANSKSFQTIADLAGTLALELEANGWASPLTKPMIFIAHSLGGVLLKQLFIILADGSNRATFMLSIIKGAIFFGTPSVGMPLVNLLTMVASQPNKGLVQDLSAQSSFLENLQMQFEGITYIRKMRLFWVYETKTSPTVVQTDTGSYLRSGPMVVMVDKESATAGRCMSDPSSTIQIDEDHSAMVKFSPGDHRISTISNKVREICWPEGQTSTMSLTSEAPHLKESDDVSKLIVDYDALAVAERRQGGSTEWNYELILESIQPPERDNRLDQIEENFGHTFNWAYDDPSVGLTQWLRRGTGIFWISGKPGSGKSTLMKFLLNDPRTAELLHKWKSKSSQIIVNFFFHHRGTLMQKSFHGLLRSLLSQLLEREANLWAIIGKILDAKLKKKLKSDPLEAIESDIRWFFRSSGLEFENGQYQDELFAIMSRDPVAHFDAIFRDLSPTMDKAAELTIKRSILSEHESLLKLKGSSEIPDYEIGRIWRKLGEVNQHDLDQFQNLVETWLNAMDTATAIRRLLKRAGFNRSSTLRLKDTGIRIRDPSKIANLDSHIEEMAKRHKSRIQAYLDIQLEEWSKSDVEEGVNHIFEQDIIDLDVCLFFDALDEYDGRPEVISEFLLDLVKQPPSSKTKARVLFSSRPWPVFQNEFATCAGFQLHDHTYEDIREYCSGLLPQDRRANHLMLPFTTDISKRARGVFLWVKLVMRDLVSIAVAGAKSNEDSTSALRQCLDSVPAELDDYYHTIVQRLPPSVRGGTYALLECISKSSVLLTTDDVPYLIGLGLAASIYESETIWESSKTMTDEDLEAYVKTISGGLVDIVPDRSTKENPYVKKKYRMQLLHQTCKEWVESATFKRIVLGSRASLLWENGHSFLAKFFADSLITDHSPGQGTTRRRLDFFVHLLESERTTGVSQFGYMSEWPTMYYDIIMLGVPVAASWSGVSLATFLGLWLYLKDAISHDEHLIQNSEEPLFSILFDSPESYPKDARAWFLKKKPGEAVDTGRFLLQHGLNLEKDTRGVSLLMSRLWESPDRPTAQLYIDLIIYATEKSLPLELRIPGSSKLFSPGDEWHLLHLSPPPLAKYLLQCGAAVNCLNDYKQTPLDYLVDPGSVHHACKFGVEWLYQSTSLLVKHGGMLRYYTPAHFENLVDLFTKHGFQTDHFSNVRTTKNALTMQKNSSHHYQKDALQYMRSAMSISTDSKGGASDTSTQQQNYRKRDKWKQMFKS
ncbi:Protein SERAC1 [Paramyrothecium foliicola]|nr:Protein SERAC1 [Paramyrothecium foliicola]